MKKSKLSSISALFGSFCLAFAAALPGQAGEVVPFVEQFVKGYLLLSPALATSQGYHENSADEQLDDYSAIGVERSRTFARQNLTAATTLLQGSISDEDRADLELIRLQCHLSLLELDRIQSYRHNPTVYVELLGNAIYTPLVEEYAPLPERMEHIIARLEKTPAFLDSAKRNLQDAPGIWLQVALQEDLGNLHLIEQDVSAKVPADLRPRYQKASAAAIAALQAFDSFLRDDLSKRESDWRLGATLYSEKFKYTLATGVTPEESLRAAEEALQQIRESMRRDAAQLYPKLFPGSSTPSDLNALIPQVLAKIALQHTTPGSYFDEAKLDLAGATRFVSERQLLPLPAGNNLQVIPTPEFERGIYGVGGFSPAPVLQPDLGAFYWITPFTPDMNAERVESKLREYNTWGLKILTIHEAMPGHYVQAEYASQVQPKWRGALRALFGNVPYVEGWAVYATQLMIEQGYDETPEMRLTFGKQMLRVVANTILDIRLQTMGMKDQQALDLMIGQTFQEREEAEKKLQRAKLSSCQLPTYFVGWKGWNQVLASERARQGTSFSLPTFHKQALLEGAVPLPVLTGLLNHQQAGGSKAN